jgi:transcriptional regulator with XRE-family HTH domain
MSTRDKLRLALETSISINTIEKWVKGARVNEANQRALERAAKALGIKFVAVGGDKSVK